MCGYERGDDGLRASCRFHKYPLGGLCYRTIPQETGLLQKQAGQNAAQLAA